MLVPPTLLYYSSQLYYISAQGNIYSASLKAQLLQYHSKFNMSPLLCVSIIHSYKLLVIPRADMMCGDSSLCCCQGKCQHVRSHFTSQMKRNPFLLLPHASQASCLKPCLCCLNGLHEWPVLLLCVWATMDLWDICLCRSCS